MSASKIFDAMELRAFLYGSAQIHEALLGPLVERLAGEEIFTVADLRVLRRLGGLAGDGQLMRAVTARKIANALDALDAQQPRLKSPPSRSGSAPRAQPSTRQVSGGGIRQARQNAPPPLLQKGGSSVVAADAEEEKDDDDLLTQRFELQPDGWNVTSMMIDHHRQAALRVQSAYRGSSERRRRSRSSSGGGARGRLYYGGSGAAPSRGPPIPSAPPRRRPTTVEEAKATLERAVANREAILRARAELRGRMLARARAQAEAAAAEAAMLSRAEEAARRKAESDWVRERTARAHVNRVGEQLASEEHAHLRQSMQRQRTSSRGLASDSDDGDGEDGDDDDAWGDGDRGRVDGLGGQSRGRRSWAGEAAEVPPLLSNTSSGARGRSHSLPLPREGAMRRWQAAGTTARTVTRWELQTARGLRSQATTAPGLATTVIPGLTGKGFGGPGSRNLKVRPSIPAPTQMAPPPAATSATSAASVGRGRSSSMPVAAAHGLILAAPSLPGEVSDDDAHDGEDHGEGWLSQALQPSHRRSVAAMLPPKPLARASSDNSSDDALLGEANGEAAAPPPPPTSERRKSKVVDGKSKVRRRRSTQSRHNGDEAGEAAAVASTYASSPAVAVPTDARGQGGGQGGGVASITELLERSALTQYTSRFHDEGYDDLPFLLELLLFDPVKLEDVARNELGMLSGHYHRFSRALGALAQQVPSAGMS